MSKIYVVSGWDSPNSMVGRIKREGSSSFYYPNSSHKTLVDRLTPFLNERSKVIKTTLHLITGKNERLNKIIGIIPQGTPIESLSQLLKAIQWNN